MNIGTGSLNDAAMAQSSVQEAELRSRHREIEASRRNLNGGNVDKEKKLRDACEGFEAMFIQKMWEGMRASLPKDGLLSGGRDEKTWQGMYDQELGKSMAKAGGIGLADMMMTQLSRNLQNASEVAAASVARREPMAIEPVPLMPAKAPQDTSKTEAAKVAASTATARPLNAATDIYGGEAVQPEAPTTPETLAAGSESSPVPGATTSANAPLSVQSALHEFATQTAPSPVAQTTAQGAGTPAGGAGVPGAEGAAVAATAAQQAALTPPVAPSAPQAAPYLPPQKVRRPPDGMPRVSRRSSGLRTSAAEAANQANMTYGPNIAANRAKPAAAEKTNTSSAPATNLMKEQMS